MIKVCKFNQQKYLVQISLDKLLQKNRLPLAFSQVLSGFVVFFLSLNILSVQADVMALSKAEQLRMITITATQLPIAIKNQVWPMADLSLASMQDGKLIPIPFQMDEINREGFPYLTQMAIENAGLPGVFDGRDELLFMLQDSSSERWSASGSKAIVPLLEFQLTTQAGPRYVYLLQHDARRSLHDYVRYDADTYFAETEFYSLASSAKNPLELTDMQFFAFEDKSKSSLLDTLKMRIQGNWIAANNGMTITNRNFQAQVVGVQQGPIRVSVQMKATIALAKMPIMNLWVMYQFSAAHMRAMTRAKTPSWMPVFVDNTSVSISVDANQLLGSQVYGVFSDQPVGLVDGRLSADEKTLQQQTLKPDQSWWMLKSPQNFQVLATLVIPENPHTSVNLIYQDDARLKVDPERFPGQWPNIGFQVSHIPLDKIYTMVFDLYVDTSKPDYDIPAYIDAVRAPLKVQIVPLSAVKN
jgi:hypothetical protein